MIKKKIDQVYCNKKEKTFRFNKEKRQNYKFKLKRRKFMYK
jgi:hypothetical protein